MGLPLAPNAIRFFFGLSHCWSKLEVYSIISSSNAGDTFMRRLEVSFHTEKSVKMLLQDLCSTWCSLPEVGCTSAGMEDDDGALIETGRIHIFPWYCEVEVEFGATFPLL